MKELSKQEIEGIEAAAEKYLAKEYPGYDPKETLPELTSFYLATKNDYIAGATEQAIKAKELAKTLAYIDMRLAMMEDYLHGEEGNNVTRMRGDIQQALLNYKP